MCLLDQTSSWNLFSPQNMNNSIWLRGDIGLVTCQNLDDVDAPWRLEKLWTCGHVGVIRSVLWDEEVNYAAHVHLSYLLHVSKARILVTGGEDGKINFWPTETCESTIAASPRKRRGGYSDDEDGDEKASVHAIFILSV